MAYTTIDDPSAHFQAITYSGNSNTSRAITNTGNSNLQPDWIWIKIRTGQTDDHIWVDTSRGNLKRLKCNQNYTEAPDRAEISSFDSNGFTLGTDDGSSNYNGFTYVAWQWKCNGGTTSSNTNGSITSTVQVNDTAGFSIVLYTGNETAGATIGHGLSAAPDVVIVKNRESTREWMFGHQAYVDGGNSENLRLNSTGAVASADDQAGSGWHRTAFGSSVFTVGDGQDGDYTEGTNNGTDDHVAYCFREIKGYSKFGSYKGNGSTDGTFVYTGFKPAFVLVKRTDTTGKNWYIADSTRSPNNITKAFLSPNLGSAEDTSGDTSNAYFDILSNGFKLRQDFSHLNASGSTQIYMAFAEHPFVSSKGVPVTAR